MIIDTHCHYNMPPLLDNWRVQWQKAQAHGVTSSLVVGADLESSERAVNIAQQENSLFAAVGIHPDAATDTLPADFDDQLEMLAADEQVVAIGEVGLDYYRLPAAPEERARHIADQQALFRRHIQLAMKTKLPLILHVRDQHEQAYWDVLSILESEKCQQPFVLHCVSGPMSYLLAALAKGAHIGVAGNVTYKNAGHLRDLVLATPKERIFLETDAPFLAPEGYRGQTCEPWMIAKTAAYVQEELGIDPDQCAANARRFFQL